nr:hypothetical protein [Tanacetum cinerariifolium]
SDQAEEGPNYALMAFSSSSSNSEVKDGAFTINLYHDGTFIENPLQYVYGSFRVVKDVNIKGMTFDDFFLIIRRLVLDKPVTMYYVAPDIQLELGLKELKTDTDMTHFVNTCKENEHTVDLYCEHHGYDVMEMVKSYLQHQEKTDSDESSDETFDKLEYVKDLVDFQNEGEDLVDIPKLTIDDPWLNKLVGKGNFIGHMDDLIPNLNGRFNIEVDDPEDHIVDSKLKAKRSVTI